MQRGRTEIDRHRQPAAAEVERIDIEICVFDDHVGFNIGAVEGVPIVTRPADQRVVAETADDGVVAAQAINRVVAAEAVNLVVLFAAGQHVVRGRAVDALEAAEQPDGDPVHDLHANVQILFATAKAEVERRRCGERGEVHEVVAPARLIEVRGVQVDEFLELDIAGPAGQEDVVVVAVVAVSHDIDAPTEQ